MRLTWLGLVLASSLALASEPPQSTPAPAPASAAPEALAASDAAAAPSEAAAAPKPAKAMTVQEAKKAGYKIVNQNGKTVYCRDQMKTGSHVRKETICLTAEEIDAAREASRRNMEQMQRVTPPPWGK